MERPTHVGNTRTLPIPACSKTVHPHACGEYAWKVGGVYIRVGSSPRVWGIRASNSAASCMSWFIPTRVGNTLASVLPVAMIAVHPHACGEYSTRGSSLMHAIGSSPRVWGIHITGQPGQRPGRFIPTRVGNTLQEDARNNRLLAELQRATEPCVLQACSDDDKKGKELCKAAPSPRKTLPGRAVMLS